MSQWPLEQALAQLDQILTTSMEVRVTNSELPGIAAVKLQTIMAEWDDKRQAPLLAQKVSQLQALRLRSPPEALGIIDGYLLTLQNRLRKRLSKPEAIRRLNDVDVQRLKLNPEPGA